MGNHINHDASRSGIRLLSPVAGRLDRAQPRQADQEVWTPARQCHRHSECRWTSHEGTFARKFTGKISRPRERTLTLRQPAQSKCTWALQEDLSRCSKRCACHKNPAPAKPGRSLSASLRGRNAHGPRAKAGLHENLHLHILHEKCRSPESCRRICRGLQYCPCPENRPPAIHLAQACAVEMHMDIAKNTFITCKFSRKKPGPKIKPNPRPSPCSSLRS